MVATLQHMVDAILIMIFQVFTRVSLDLYFHTFIFTTDVSKKFITAVLPSEFLLVTVFFKFVKMIIKGFWQ